MMRMASIRICLCYLLPLLFNEGVLVWSSGFEFLSFSDLVNNATHLYGLPINTNTATEDLLHTSRGHILFPCMNFTCSGRITKLMFIAPTVDETSQSVIMTVQWPQFSLCRGYDDCTGEECCMPSWPEGSNFLRQHNKIYGNQNYGIYEIDFSTSNYTFQRGEFLRVSYPSPCRTRCQRVNILYQNGGGYCPVKLVYCGSWTSSNQMECYIRMQSGDAIFPYIAIETDNNSQNCVRNHFLNRESLIKIVDASESGYSPNITFPQRWYNFIYNSKQINRSGKFLKVLIAARFNYLNAIIVQSQFLSCLKVSDYPPSSWPVIEIWRNNGTNWTRLVPICQEPRPSGYLNVFEYEWSVADIQVGDVIRIKVPLTSSSKYVPAFLGGSQPMMHIIISNSTDRIANSETTTTESRATSDSDITVFQILNTNSEHIRPQNLPVIRIAGGVLGALILIIALAVALIIVFVIYRWKKNTKQFSPTTGTNVSANTRSGALENVYIHDDDLPVGDQSESTGAAVGRQRHGALQHPTTDQQEDYYFYKVYEWGVFVPTVAEREAATATGTSSEVEADALYSTLGEGQYSTLLQFNQTPEFFHESEDYWTPASDEKSLYQQLSSKKYREILKSQIEVSDQLGSGQFGTVMKGVWLLSGGSKEVAVKVLKEGSSEQDKVRFLQEAAINGQFWHPNVVRLMGVVTVGEPTMIVLEYLPNGDLRSYLTKMQPTPGEMVSTNTPHALLRWCKEIASGMKYLAQKKFVHRDLAARNILLSEEKTCKIGDFGMSRNLEDDSYYVSRGGMIPVKWTAPEALHYKKYSTSSDVWSFGALLYEVWSLGHKPFEGYGNREVIRKVDSGFRLSPPPGCPRDIYQLMIQCWNPEKNQRPSFADLHASLSDHAFPLQMKESETPDELHPLALTIGAPLEAGKGLYTDLQNTYLRE